MNLSVDLLAGIAVAVLTSSVLVALVNWLRDRKFISAQEENLATISLREALEAVRAELNVVRTDLETTTRALREALGKLHRYELVLGSAGLLPKNGDASHGP